MVRDEGFEPPFTTSKAAVLPLDESRICNCVSTVFFPLNRNASKHYPRTLNPGPLSKHKINTPLKAGAKWFGYRDSNPDSKLQRLASYR